MSQKNSMENVKIIYENDIKYKQNVKRRPSPRLLGASGSPGAAMSPLPHQHHHEGRAVISVEPPSFEMANSAPRRTPAIPGETSRKRAQVQLGEPNRAGRPVPRRPPTGASAAKGLRLDSPWERAGVQRAG